MVCDEKDNILKQNISRQEMKALENVSVTGRFYLL